MASPSGASAFGLKFSKIEHDVGSPASTDDERLLSTDPSTSRAGLHFSWRELFRGKKQRNSEDDRSNAVELRMHHERVLTLRKLVRCPPLGSKRTGWRPDALRSAYERMRKRNPHD